MFPITPAQVRKLLEKGSRLPLATQNYPSRGQSAVQELYQTRIGKLFLKRVNARNHQECQIDIKSGTLAEREFWAYRLAKAMGLRVPPLLLLDPYTTVQEWFDLPDGKQYKTSQGMMNLQSENIFSCALFDWITGQIDRHDANYLYDMVREEIILVDSAHAFLKYSGSIPDYLYLFEASQNHDLHKKNKAPIKKMKSLLSKELLKIVPLRDSAEADALQERLQSALEVCTLQELITLYRG